jgi:hypothetical protein
LEAARPGAAEGARPPQPVYFSAFVRADLSGIGDAGGTGDAVGIGDGGGITERAGGIGVGAVDLSAAMVGLLAMAEDQCIIYS